MTFVIVLLCMFSYAGIGLAVGAYSRIRSVDKSFRKNIGHVRNLYDRRGEEYVLKETMRRVKSYDSADWAFAAFLGGFFWPVFLLGFTWHWAFHKFIRLIGPHMPASNYEKQIADLVKAREVEDERKRIIKEARKLGIDTHALESLGD